MRHFSCDGCGKNLIPGEHARTIVRMEAYPAADPRELTEADFDQDHLDAMADVLRELEAAGPEALELAPIRRRMEFDLCANCYQRFCTDPLGREAGRKLHVFSKN